MNKILIITIAAALAGCAQQPYKHSSNWAPSASSQVASHPDYHKDLRQCRDLAAQNAQNPAANAALGAGVGAGLFALASLALGADPGPLVGLAALAGGAGGLANSEMTNEQRYREVMVRCLRDRNHQVY